MAQFYVVASDASFATQVAQGLRARGWTVFDRSQVLPGDDVASTLDRELRAAGCVVVMVGAEEDVRSAAIAAIQRRRLNPLVRVVPVVRQGIDLGQAFSSLNLLTRVTLTGDVDALVDRLDDTGERTHLRAWGEERLRVGVVALDAELSIQAQAVARRLGALSFIVKGEIGGCTVLNAGLPTIGQ